MKFKQYTHTFLSDTITPVLCFMRIRERYYHNALLESNDYGAQENSKSILGFDPLLQVQVDHSTFSVTTPQGTHKSEKISTQSRVADLFWELMCTIEIEERADVPNGFFGHTSFEAVQHFDTIQMDGDPIDKVPLMNYSFFRFLIIFDHYRDLVTLVENCPTNQSSELEAVKELILKGHTHSGAIKIGSDESANMTDEEFMNIVSKSKAHCRLGDIFQIVPSRRFRRSYEGDDFQIYRVLRTVNPSPYLYYFSFENYSIFGSSPEHQLIIQDRRALVNPIAGTYRRTGDDQTDRKRAKELTEDPKEQSEHMMLLDLARNDLGRHTTDVTVTKMKEVKYYSHVIHLVSQVEGKIPDGTNPIQVFGDTFPAGTLSGAPKFKAMQLIHDMEPHPRSFYGGGIGYFDLNGDVTHAIVIRSFLCQNNHICYQAGAGIVEKSIEQSELEEVNNKLGALRTTLDIVNKTFNNN